MIRLLEVKNLSTTFKQNSGAVTVVDGVDFGLETGETLPKAAGLPQGAPGQWTYAGSKCRNWIRFQTATVSDAG